VDCWNGGGPLPPLPRRKFLLVGGGAAITGATFHLPPSNAVAPISSQPSSYDDLPLRIQRFFRPKPSTIALRPKLSLEFAVQLMRSSYAVTDELDIIPMNQFQRDFFLLRSAEYEPYVKSLGFVNPGDLTDPNYFDFISFAQYLTINRAISSPETIFEELQPVEVPEGQPQQFRNVLVRRTIPDELLIPTFDNRVGTSILNYLETKYADTDVAIPKGSNNNLEQSLEQLLKLFVLNGFAWDAKVERNDKQWMLEIQSPATLWGSTCLSGSPLQNDFVLKTAKQLVQTLGYTVASSSRKIVGTQERNYLTIL
jgi:hypothetical protein